MADPNPHAFRNPAAHGQSWVSTGHILHSAGSGGRGRRGAGGMIGAPDVGTDVGGDHYASGGSGGGTVSPDDHEQAVEEQPQAEPAQHSGEPIGRPASKPYVGAHRPQPPTPADYVGRMEDSLGDRLDGPRRTSWDPESGRFQWGEPTVKRPGSLPATDPSHPLMSNYAHILAGLQEPGAPQT